MWRFGFGREGEESEGRGLREAEGAWIARNDPSNPGFSSSTKKKSDAANFPLIGRVAYGAGSVVPSPAMRMYIDRPHQAIGASTKSPCPREARGRIIGSR